LGKISENRMGRLFDSHCAMFVLFGFFYCYHYCRVYFWQMSQYTFFKIWFASAFDKCVQNC